MGNKLFNQIQLTKPQKNVFDLSHDVKLSGKMGDLIPTMAMECIPGDSINIGNESLLRFAPLVSPVMHRMDLTMHYFFVPNRLLWSRWEDFITNKATVAFPTITMGDDGRYTRLADYLGIPKPIVGSGTYETISALPFAAYQMIYQEYYRDQNLQNDVPFELVSGDNNANTDLLVLRKRAWEHDYFTSALPFAQKGNPVTIPITTPLQFPRVEITGVDGTTLSGTPLSANIASTGGTVGSYPDGTLVTRNESVSASGTINDLRRAYRLQEWLEKAARGGSRYVENILAHFGVKSPDSRLQRPEYITGSKSPVIISEVLNTTGTTDLPQGNMAGHALSIDQNGGSTYHAQEHGYIIGIMSVLPKTAYQQGIPKHFLKTNDPFQYFWPSFANIGEQPIENRELYAYGTNGTQTFGYTPRYAEYKFENNRVAGDFRTSLDFWHMGRIFSSQPALNASFVQSNPTDRIFAVNDGTDYLYCHILHKVRAVRSMPKFGTPQF